MKDSYMVRVDVYGYRMLRFLEKLELIDVELIAQEFGEDGKVHVLVKNI